MSAATRELDNRVAALVAAVTEQRDAEGRTRWIVARDLPGVEPEAAARSLARLAKAGRLERQVRRTYATVSVRWGFGGTTACLRKKAEYRLVGS